MLSKKIVIEKTTWLPLFIMAICEKKKILLYIVSSKSKKSVLKKDHFLPADRKTLCL